MQPEHQLPPSQQPTPVLPPPAPKRGLAAAISAFFAYWLVSWILVPVGLVLLLHFFVFSAYHVVGSSMIPTLEDSDYLIVSKVDHTGAMMAHQPYLPARGQVVVFHYPKQPDLDFVKRVIALPGERVTIKDCQVRVYNAQHPDGFNPDSDHAMAGQCTEADSGFDQIVPENNLFVLGDNRTPGGSSDSREWGFLPASDVVGNVVLRLFPLASVRTF